MDFSKVTLSSLGNTFAFADFSVAELSPRDVEVLRVGLEEGINATLRAFEAAGVNRAITLDLYAMTKAAAVRLMPAAASAAPSTREGASTASESERGMGGEERSDGNQP